MEYNRAALAVWIRKLDISANVIESGAHASNAVEDMLDWLVVPARCGWTPHEVLTCFFPVFGDLLFHLITNSFEEE